MKQDFFQYIDEKTETQRSEVNCSGPLESKGEGQD